MPATWAKAITAVSGNEVNIYDGTISATTGTAVSNYSTSSDSIDTINISGGTISATTGTAVSGATINISGGTVSATTGSAVSSGSIATNISGGSISATNGYAINSSTAWNHGLITISEAIPSMPTHVSSENTDPNQGTIYLSTSGSSGPLRLEITGGTVENTASGNAVYNNSINEISISGGTVSAISGAAVYNAHIGALNISGGTVMAETGNAVYESGRYYTGTSSVITISGTALVSSGNTTANEGTVYFAAGGVAAHRLLITGGTVENTAAGGNAVFNNDTYAWVSISGGKVSATTGSAAYNYGNGKIYISGTAMVSSANTGANSGTVYLTNNSSSTSSLLEITGGTVENTANPATNYAVYNDSTGVATITGATITCLTFGVTP